MAEEKENISGAKCAITQKKLDNLYNIVQTFKKQTLIAKRLGVDSRTFTSWLEKGAEILSQHKEFNAELTDSVLDGVVEAQEYIDKNKEQITKDFLEKTYASEIGVKNAGRLNDYVDELFNEFVEQYTNKLENEMIDNYEFHENDSKNETYKKYVKVFRIYTRAELSMKEKYIGNVDRHASTGKNVGLSMKMLEITDDDFRVKPMPNINIENNNGSISFIDLISTPQENKEEV